MSHQHDQPGAVPLAQHRPRRAAAMPAQTYEQRALRARSPRAARPIPTPTAGPSSRPNGYPCPELARPAGVPDARFAAFEKPSRVGNWLHYPDGRREPFPC